MGTVSCVPDRGAKPAASEAEARKAAIQKVKPYKPRSPDQARKNAGQRTKTVALRNVHSREKKRRPPDGADAKRGDPGRAGARRQVHER
jgi:hypothetical protein